jgi:hypothetical protein
MAVINAQKSGRKMAKIIPATNGHTNLKGESDSKHI